MSGWRRLVSVEFAVHSSTCCVWGWESAQFVGPLCVDMDLRSTLEHIGNSVAVPRCNQEVHVGCLAQSFNACKSPVFQAAALFSAHQPWNQFLGPPDFPCLRICRCCVAAVWVFHHSSNQASTDVWSGLWQQLTLAWDLQWICFSCSRTVPTGDIPSCPQVLVECAVIHPTCGRFSIEWWNRCTRCQTRVPQEVRRTL